MQIQEVSLVGRVDMGTRVAWAVLRKSHIHWVLFKAQDTPRSRDLNIVLDDGGTESSCTLEAFYGALPYVGSLRVLAPKGARSGRYTAKDCRLKLVSWRGELRGKWPQTELGWRDTFLTSKSEVLDSIVRPAIKAARAIQVPTKLPKRVRNKLPNRR